MKCRLIREMDCDPRDGFPYDRHPIGTEIEHPDAFRLVQMGCALPADEECEKRAGMNPDSFARAQYAYERLSRGISHEDFAAYDQGLMTGYDPDGSWILGPNAG